MRARFGNICENHSSFTEEKVLLKHFNMSKYANVTELRGLRIQNKIHKPALKDKEIIVYFVTIEFDNVNHYTIFELNRFYSTAVFLPV